MDFWGKNFENVNEIILNKWYKVEYMVMNEIRYILWYVLMKVYLSSDDISAQLVRLDHWNSFWAHL